MPNNNNNVNGVKSTKAVNGDHASTWKFWRTLSMRRSKKSFKHNGNIKSVEEGGFGINVSVNLPDVVERADATENSTSKAPSKPPRNSKDQVDAADSGIGNETPPDDVDLDETLKHNDYENVDSNGVILNFPPKNAVIDKVVAANQKCNSLPNYSIPSSFQRRQQTSTAGRIKIVSPDLTRKVISKPRKKSAEITATDRHVLILQSAIELLCQKVDPFMVLDKLADANLLDPKVFNLYRNPVDHRYIIEGIVNKVIEEDYSTFLHFCDILRSVADFTTVVNVLDAMRAIYDVIYEVQMGVGESSPLLDDDKSVSFDVVYYNLETGKVRSVVELEKLRNTENKRHSRDLMSFKRNSRLSFQSLTSEASSVFSEDIITNGLPMVTVSVSGHALCLAKAIALSDVIKEQESILELHIGKTHIRGPDMSHICSALAENYNVRVMDLRLNNIGNEGAVHLANALAKNKTLCQLNLSSTGIDAEGCNAIAEALKTNISLVDLDLSFLDIGDDGCVSIRDMLKQNRCLKKLRLRSTNLSWLGCGLLLEGIEIGKEIVELDLSRNFIGDAGADMFLRHMKDDSSLRDINLENCGITTAGCSIMSDVILTNKSVRHLDLSVNFIGDQGIVRLSNALERNRHIKTLGLNMCGISNDGFSRLLDVLASNTTLTLVKLCYNRLGKEHTNPDATSDNLKYRVRIVTSSNPKLKLLLWGNTFEEAHSPQKATELSS